MRRSTAEAPVRPHLSGDELALLRSLLLCEMVTHADRAAECRATADELTGQTDTDSLLERELAQVSATKLFVTLLEAREALRRLDDGTYGMCETCEMPIPYERLDVIPHARHCVSCSPGPAGLLF